MTKALPTATCTKGTTACTRQVTVRLPMQVRKLEWETLASGTGEKVCLGKGVFGTCYFIQIGPINACLKVFRSERKYLNTLFNEIQILLKLNHQNVPWLYGVCYNLKHPRAIAMSYHSFCGGNESATLHAVLKTSKFHEKVTHDDWKSILFGGLSALNYLYHQKILHNDIKSDNMVIEYLPPGYTSCRCVLIDFGKACLIFDALLYKLSEKEKEMYKKHHPQIAPEVRNGLEKQSFCSDIYSFGRIIQLINGEKLKIPVLYKMAEQCLDACSQKRPFTTNLHKFLKNLFSVE